MSWLWCLNANITRMLKSEQKNLFHLSIVLDVMFLKHEHFSTAYVGATQRWLDDDEFWRPSPRGLYHGILFLPPLMLYFLFSLSFVLPDVHHVHVSPSLNEIKNSAVVFCQGKSMVQILGLTKLLPGTRIVLRECCLFCNFWSKYANHEWRCILKIMCYLCYGLNKSFWEIWCWDNHARISLCYFCSSYLLSFLKLPSEDEIYLRYSTLLNNHGSLLLAKKYAHDAYSISVCYSCVADRMLISVHIILCYLQVQEHTFFSPLLLLPSVPTSDFKCGLEQPIYKILCSYS